MRLKDKVALIPGGTSGIGEQIAYAFAREGATVVVASRSRERVERVGNAIKEIGQGEGITADITDPDQVRAMVAQVIADYGKIDIMLNTVGVYPATPIEQISPEELQNVININLIGPFYCAQAAAKEMKKQRYGRIIFISSGQALRGVPLMAHYSAAKGGLVALARVLASELGPFGITVNTIAAGLTTTDEVKKSFPPDFLETVAQAVPLKRVASPGEYNGVAVMLASDEGAYITGVTIAVDGGITQADSVK